MVLVAVQASEFSLTVLACKWFKTSVQAKMALVASKIRENFSTVATLRRQKKKELLTSGIKI